MVKTMVGKSVTKGKTQGADKYFKCMLLSSLRSAILATIFTIALILIFALILKNGGISENSIPLINQIIKISSVVLAAILNVIKVKEKFFLAGALAGVMYVLIGFLTFSLIEGNMGSFLALLSDALMAALIGAIAAIIFSQFKRKK
ncbi:MAG: TIGR04086 family membrane protein [Eubacteriales bacterium]